MCAIIGQKESPIDVFAVRQQGICVRLFAVAERLKQLNAEPLKPFSKGKHIARVRPSCLYCTM